MAKKKIEDVSNENLKKRKKFFVVIRGIYFGLILVYLAFFIYDLIDGGQFDKSLYYGLIGIIGTIWIPLFALKEINAEQERRNDNQVTKKLQSDD